MGRVPGRVRLFAVPGFAPLFASSWLWHATRWGGLFLGTYMVTKLTHAPFLSQLAGASIFAPMLVGGIAAGVLSDRFDRHLILYATSALLIPASAVMTALVATGIARVWMVFPYMLILGLGGLVNMTSQRTLIYDTVGPALAARALTLDTVGMASANVASTLLGGAVIQVVGVGAAFGLISLALALAVMALHRVPRPRPVDTADPPGPGLSLRQQVRCGLVAARRSPGLRSVLGVTVVMNMCHFAFLPLVPVIADRLGANAALTGVLAAAAGTGQLLSGLVLARRGVGRPARLFVAGSFVALAAMAALAFAPVLALAVLALLVAGIGQAGFGSMQSLLAIESADQAGQGAALGLLCTAVGALPLGMLGVGVVAQSAGAPATMVGFSVGGLAILGVWLRREPKTWEKGRVPGLTG